MKTPDIAAWFEDSDKYPERLSKIIPRAKIFTVNVVSPDMIIVVDRDLTHCHVIIKNHEDRTVYLFPYLSAASLSEDKKTVNLASERNSNYVVLCTWNESEETKDVAEKV